MRVLNRFNIKEYIVKTLCIHLIILIYNVAVINSLALDVCGQSKSKSPNFYCISLPKQRILMKR